MSDLSIRVAREADCAAIIDVTLAAYAQYAPVMGEHWELYRRDIAETLAEARAGDQIVAERDGSIVGAVLLIPAGALVQPPGSDSFRLQAPEVRLLAVAPAARGLGVGQALMRECMRRSRAAGAEALTLHTHEMMQVAMRLYERLGFARAPELDFHPIPEVTIKGFRISLDDHGSGPR